MPAVPLGGVTPVVVTALVESGNTGCVKYRCPFWLVQPVGGGHPASRVLFLVLITVSVSSPRFSTKRRCRSALSTAYTGHLPTGIDGSVVLLAISIGVATPSGDVLGETLHWISPAGVSGTFWLRTYSRSP